MNRIRKYNNKYQVIFTPNQKYNAGFEFMLGSWTDEGLMGFDVKEYNTYHEAECLASNYPDINWEQLVYFHKDNYYFLKKEISNVIKNTGLVVDFIPNLLDPNQTKDKMFNRILKGKTDTSNTFRLVYDMNDIISFIITNPWTKNLIEMEQHLLKNSRLNIFKKLQKNGIVHLIGRTDIGTTYEIILTPSIIYNWMKWSNLNPNISIDIKITNLRNILDTQKVIDKRPSIR